MSQKMLDGRTFKIASGAKLSLRSSHIMDPPPNPQGPQHERVEKSRAMPSSGHAVALFRRPGTQPVPA
jgi:hypothetical protein